MVRANQADVRVSFTTVSYFMMTENQKQLNKIIKFLSDFNVMKFKINNLHI